MGVGVKFLVYILFFFWVSMGGLYKILIFDLLLLIWCVMLVFIVSGWYLVDSCLLLIILVGFWNIFGFLRFVIVCVFVDEILFFNWIDECFFKYLKFESLKFFFWFFEFFFDWFFLFNIEYWVEILCFDIEFLCFLLELLCGIKVCFLSFFFFIVKFLNNFDFLLLIK